MDTPEHDILGIHGLRTVDVKTHPDFPNQIAFVVEPEFDTVPEYCCNTEYDQVTRNGTREIRYRDLPYYGKYAELILHRQRVRCNLCGAFRYMGVLGVHPDHRMTWRAYEYLGRSGVRRTFAEVAREMGISEGTVRKVFKSYSQEKLKEACIDSQPEVLGLDEKHLNGQYRCVLGNIKDRTLIDMLPNRHKATLDRYFASLLGKEEIRVVCTDMYDPYRQVAREHLTQAAVVVDRFHVVNLATTALNNVRRRVGKRLSDKDRARLSHARELLMQRGGGKTDEARAQLEEWFSMAPILSRAYWAKEHFANLYQVAKTRAEAEAYYDEWVRTIPKGLSKDFKKLQDSVHEWRNEILAYFDHPYTTGYVEGVNNMLSTMQRMGAGYAFEQIRAKALLAQSSHKLTPVRFRRMIIDFFGSGDDEPMLNLGVSIDWLQQILDTPGAFESLDPFDRETEDQWCLSAT